jgi:hypothetical protein
LEKKYQNNGENYVMRNIAFNEDMVEKKQVWVSWSVAYFTGSISNCADHSGGALLGYANPRGYAKTSSGYTKTFYGICKLEEKSSYIILDVIYLIYFRIDYRL